VRYLAFEVAGTPMDGLTAHHAAALLLRALERRCGEPAVNADPINRALILMQERCAELAGSVGMAPSRFHELFRARTGTTPARRLTDLRLDRAAALLRSGDLPIAEVALAVGFSDQSALTRCLRQRRGTTPAALRRGL
jgi:transcriptional regulator GlxA family with amidase domain